MTTNDGYATGRRRADSFLGIHFDFHARDTGTAVGAHFDRGVVERIIERVRPDYIQCDCKGHHGVSSYPTAVGYPAPGLVGDPLRIWREVTAEHGVALYVHFSGVFDEKAVEMHPEWALVDASGEVDARLTSVFGDYVDAYMVPQLKELVDVYHVDGMWVDGDCWSTERDYGAAAAEAFSAATGGTELPRRPTDGGYEEFSRFCRQAFLRYLRHYLDVLHAHEPAVQMASNWAFSSFMPEEVSAPVDFLSGDAFNDCPARLEARCLAAQGRPWDLMTWSFAGRFELHGPPPTISVKSVAQLQQEAAMIIAHGGGYQSVSNQKLDGSVIEWQLEVMQAVGRFCRQREALCHQATMVAQVGLLYSATAHYRASASLFKSVGELGALIGVLNCLLDSQHVVNIVLEHQVHDLLDRYPVVVVPEWDELPGAVVDALLGYVEAGGRLVVVGARALRPFEAALDLTPESEIEEAAAFWVESRGWLAGCRRPRRRYRVGGRAQAFGRVFEQNDNSGQAAPAGAIAQLGAGTIAGLFFDIGQGYLEGSTSTLRSLLGSLVDTVFPDQLVQVSGSGFVEVVAGLKDGKLVVHLINTAGDRDNPRVAVFDEIPPIGPLEVKVRLPEAPGPVRLEPEGSTPQHSFADGVLRVVVERVDIHAMVVIGTALPRVPERRTEGG